MWPFWLRMFWHLVFHCCRFLGWILVGFWRLLRKNLLLTCGLLLFCLTFTLVGYNAIFLQKGSSIDRQLRALISDGDTMK